MSADVDTLKEQAGRQAAAHVEDGMRVGLGTGSTVHWTIVDLGERALDITCTATSERTAELATSLGLTVVAPDEIGRSRHRDRRRRRGGSGVQPHQGWRRCVADMFGAVVSECETCG